MISEVQVAVFLSTVLQDQLMFKLLTPVQLSYPCIHTFFLSFRGYLFSDHHRFRFSIKWDLPVSTKANSTYPYSEIPIHYLNYFFIFHPIKSETPDELKACLWKFQSSFSGNSNWSLGSPSRQTVRDVSHTPNTFADHNLELCV